MTLSEIPYFMTNQEWYYFDKEKLEYVLTDKAPQEAIQSYYEYVNSNANGEILER